MGATTIAVSAAAAPTIRGATGSCLTAKGYDVNYCWGMNLLGQKFGGQIMPRDDALAPARRTGFNRPERQSRARFSATKPSLTIPAQ
jgi:hypothetical protein